MTTLSASVVIDKYPNYQISPKGVIKNRLTGKFLKQFTDNNGYFMVGLSRESRSYKHRVHRLLALNLIPNPQNLPAVNHKDGNKQNNELSNLEWCSHKENAAHAVRNGLRTYNSIKRPVRCLTLSGRLVRTYPGVVDAHRDTGIHHIVKACKGIYKHAGGYKWAYV